ncbi:MAG: ABC transporter [Spirochaetes bacterium]|jgi:gliding-associated putative ABC transporter substrate-binding component GldG|nr:ABC transporter [Spirochaetota bacterium]
MSKRIQEIISFFLALAVILAVVLNSTIYFLRLDMTENKVFTISEVSRNLFQEIPEQVNITYYLSDRLEQRAVETQQIVDILNEYAAYSRGKINVDVVDPQARGITSQVESQGVVPQQIQVIEEDQQSLAVVYTGIVISYLDESETLPVVFDPAAIEYELTSTIRNLVQGTEDIVGVLLGSEDEQMSQFYTGLQQTLSRSFEVRPVEQGEEVPPEISALFVLGGSDLDEFDLFPIDQYIMNGGKALLAVDGVNVEYQRAFQASAPDGWPIFDMLESYGVQIRQSLVLDTQNQRIPVRRAAGRVSVQSLEPYPHWVSITGQGASSENAITARFSGLDLYWPSPVTILPEADDKAQVLLESSPESWIMEEPFVINPQQAPMFQRNAADTRGAHILGVVLSGGFTSYFDGKQIPTREGVETDWNEITSSVGSNRMIVVGDSDFAGDLYQFTESRYNITFLENVAEWLSNEDDLLQIKTRATRDVRLNDISDPAVKARVATFAEVFNIFIVPLAVIAFGVVRFWRRREKHVTRKSGGDE